MELVLGVPVSGVEQQTGAIDNDTLATGELLQLESHSSNCSFGFGKTKCWISSSLENLRLLLTCENPSKILRICRSSSLHCSMA